jgi:hypothetical protein
MAVALAEVGQFDRAIEMTDKAVRAAVRQRQTGLANQMLVRQRLYREGQPFHQPR